MIVLDASAAINMINGTEAGMALRTLLLQGERSIAPSLYCAEVCNAFWKYAQAGIVTPDIARARAQASLTLVDEFVNLDPLYAEALSEACRLAHSVYDMFYLVLARRNAATLFTLDAKLRSLCEANGVNVVSLVGLPKEDLRDV